MLKFDRKKFFDGVKEHIDSTLEQEQVDGFTFLLDRFESTPMWSSIPLIAYGLATPYHETAGSMQPVEEGYYLERYGKKRVRDFQKSLRYFPFFGRGYVQLTWETRRIPNYSRATRELREQMPLLVGVFEEKTGKTFDLVKYPDQALDPLIAFAVMTLGMFQGWFTTKKITDFIHGSTKNYKDARTVINGHDKAALIAGYAKTFEGILRNASGTTELAAIKPEDSGDAAEPLPAETPAEAGAPGVVIERETEQPGFFKALWKKIMLGVSTIGGTDQATAYAEKVNAFGLPSTIWTKIYYTVAILAGIWFAYELYLYFICPWLKRRRTDKLIDANRNTPGMVTVAKAEDLAKYEAEGWVPLRRS